MTQKGTWNGLFLASLLQLDKYQGTKHNNPGDGKEDGKHRHSAISGMYKLHQDIFLKYEGANYSLFNTVNNSRSKMLRGNKASWELFNKMCYIFTAICRNGLFRQISQSKICNFLPPLLQLFLTFQNEEGKTFCLNFVFKYRSQKTNTKG